ncbi:tellurite resistance TerB family protein [Psychroserpens mesophilus]|uniref:tellurite resistance TerB family protein n=1 Tax=Psychroserpens mesophilus TaxID=325473 RepID=UPI00058E6753|nr:tellurite resistance TerB family protein [Psychroserpens mesophilus]
MGLFSNVLKGNESDSSFTNEEAFLGTIVAITAADGDISDEEMSDLKSIINKSQTLSDVDDNTYSKIVNKVFRVLRKDGVDHLVNLSVNGLSDSLYEGVFALVCDLAYSDGFIEKDEERVLERLQQEFNISDSTALNIVKVITVKNLV